MYDNANQLWTSACEYVLARGERSTSRNGTMTEVIGYRAELRDPSKNLVHCTTRNMSVSYAAAELLWYLSGISDVLWICHYAPSYKNFTDNGLAYGAYGERWVRHLQVETIIKLLKTHPDTRQAVMTMWEAADLGHALIGDKRDLPCTVSLQFILRLNKLNLIATMRSNDIWLGMPYDIFAFTTIQHLFAGMLEVEVGTYVHQVGSLHAYDKNADKISRVCYEPPPALWHIWQHGGQTSLRKAACEAIAIAETARTTGQLLLHTLQDGIIRDLTLMCCSRWLTILGEDLLWVMARRPR